MRAAHVVCALVLVGCGTDDVDLSGVYAVTLDVASAPCGNDAPVAMGPAYLHFFKAELFGQTVFQYDECKDREANDCFAAGGLFESLAEPIDNGWQGRTSSSSMTATRCLMTYVEETAIANGSHLTVERTRYEYDGDIPATGCSIDEAERRGTTMDCKSHSRREAEKQ
jgi:hypothetical protein